MKPEEMRDDIPEDVREALAAWSTLCDANDVYNAMLMRTLNPKPRTVRMPAADIPAPLTEVPDSGWTIAPLSDEGVVFIVFIRGALGIRRVLDRGLLWATKDDALAALAAFTAREPATKPGADWTPHTPGDPMPCDGKAVVEVRSTSGGIGMDDAEDWQWGRIEDNPESEITAWRYAREES